MTLKLSSCMEVVSRMGQRDQDAILAYLEDNESRGLPRDRAQLLAAESVLRDLVREQGDVTRSAARSREDEVAARSDGWRIIDAQLPSKESAEKIISSRQKVTPRGPGMWEDYELRAVVDDVDGFWAIEARKKGDATRSAKRSLFNPGFNPELPRGAVLEPTAAELALEAELLEVEQRAAMLWAQGKRKAIAALIEGNAGKFKELGFDEEVQKSVANSMFHSRRQADIDEVEEGFEGYHEAVKEVDALRERRMDMISDRVGPPEFEGMQQLADFQRPITETENFKRWFDSSKVVAKDGKPLIVFHGTNRDFSEFRTVLPGDKQVSNNNWMGELGSWFAAPSTSGEYDIGNAEVTADTFAEMRGSSADGDVNPGAVVYPVFLSIKNPYETEGYEDVTEQRDEAGGGKAFRQMLIEEGYDGVVIRDSNTDGGQYRDDWIAFYPEQIKSALGNNGNFDPKDADITRSRARDVVDTPKFKSWFGKSLVVGEDGEPQAMYHGSYRDVSWFDRKKSTEWRRESMDAVGSWFSDNPSDDGGAGMYANGDGAAIYPVYLRIERPKVYDAFSQFLKDMHESAGREVPDNAPGLGSPEALRDKLKAQGYDGIAFMKTENGKVHAEIESIMEKARAVRWSDPKGYKKMLAQANALDAEIGGTRSTEFDKQYVWVAFEPEQIKSAVGNSGEFDREDRDITRSRARPQFFSQLQRAIEQVPERLATMAAPQWKQWLDANAAKAGVKKEEIEWSGITDYLKLRGKDKVSKADLAAFLGDNGVKVQDVVLGGPNYDRRDQARRELKDWAAEHIDDDNDDGGLAIEISETDNWMEVRRSLADYRVTPSIRELVNVASGDAEEGSKYSKYTVPGGENYREVLITLPTSSRKYRVVEQPEEADYAKFAVFDESGKVNAFARRSQAEARAAELNEKAIPVEGSYISRHWDGAHPNILAHLRLDDRTDADGKRVLFINEVQSDWAQDGRKKRTENIRKLAQERGLTEDEAAKHVPADAGFAGKPVPREELEKLEAALQGLKTRRRAMVAADRAAGRDQISSETDAVLEEEAALQARINMAKRATENGVPRAPFVTDTKSWVSLALKRAIMIAAEGGYDRVAMITGQQAADLYDLSKQVEQIRYTKKGDDLYDVWASDEEGRSLNSNVEWLGVSIDKVEEVVGKDVAKRIAEGKGIHSFDDEKEMILKGLDLKVGGEGMQAFYDKIVPQIANDVLKKLGGGKVGEVDFVNQDFGKDPFVNEHPEFGYAVIDRESGLYFDLDKDGWTGEAPTSMSKSVAEKMVVAIKEDGQKGHLRQPGFDITPEMHEKVAAGVPLFSRGRTATGANWDSPSAAKFDDLVYKLQDKLVDTKRVVEAIKDASGAIADDLNVYLQEEMFHGRAAKRTEDFVNDELNPLVKQLDADGLSMADVEEFLHARHAPEANRVIAQRNPGVAALQDGGSGMLTADAQQYLASLDPAQRAKLDAAAAKVDAIITKTRQLYVDYQLEGQETVDAWGKMFQYYIPLQREDKDGRGSPGIGQGFSVKGRETKGRTGSTRKVVDILANVAMQRERAIVRGEKNRVSLALVGLATANPNADFWAVNEVPRERVFNPETGLVEERHDPMYKNRPHVVVAKMTDPSGEVKEHAVLFNEDDERAMRMAAALKNLDAGNLEGLLGISAKITRYFAAVNTQYNPVFGIVNLIRDVQSAMLNLSSTPLKGAQGKIARDAFKALAGIYADTRAVRKGNHPASAWAKLWEEFQDVGGQTGYRDLFRTSAERGEAIQHALDPNAWMDGKLGKIFTANGALKVPMAEAQKGASWVFNWLSDYNLAMENGVRLAAYKEGLARGLSKEQAASAAKNLTVNFNRKGQVSQQAGAVYAFFNASVQGTARLAQTLFDMEPGKPKTIRLSKTGKTIVYGGLLLGSVQALMLAAAGFSDEDPPEFVRERSLIIPIGGKKYLTVPMPLGFHIIPATGRMVTEFALSGFKDPHKRAMAVVGMLADTFNPIGNAGLSMQTIAPTALDPLVALTENRDWTGKPIARESSNKAMPGHLLARDTSSSLARALSEGINYASGGNAYVAGVMSPTPDQIDYLIGQVTGGVGRELSKVEQTSVAMVRGEELPTHKVPVLGRFYGDAKQQASEGTAFYANADRLNKIETEIKGLQKDGKTVEANELRSLHPEAYLIGMANQAERQLQKLRAEKRELVRKGADRDQVRAVEERITGVMSRLNRAAEKLAEQAQ